MSSSTQTTQPDQPRGMLLSLLVLMLPLSILITRYFLSGRLWDVRYDLFASPGGAEGYVGTDFVLFSAMVTLIAVTVSIYALLRNIGRRRWLWALCLILAVVPALGFDRAPADRDALAAAKRGQLIVSALDRYKTDSKKYPTRLSELVPNYLDSIPGTGMAEPRRFFYAKKGGTDTGEVMPSFAGPARFLGDAPYVIVVPMVPRGTLVYRPDGKYSDLKGIEPVSHGWVITNID